MARFAGVSICLSRHCQTASAISIHFAHPDVACLKSLLMCRRHCIVATSVIYDGKAKFNVLASGHHTLTFPHLTLYLSIERLRRCTAISSWVTVLGALAVLEGSTPNAPLSSTLAILGFCTSK